MERDQKAKLMVFMVDRGYFDLGDEITTAADVVLAKFGGSHAPHMSVMLLGETYETKIHVLDDLAYGVMAEHKSEMRDTDYQTYIAYTTFLLFESVFDCLSKHRQLEILSDMMEEGFCLD